MKIKHLLVFICVFLLLISLSSFAFADSYTLYGSVTPSSSQVNILRSFYESSPYFNPFAHYCFLRSGQNVYKLVVQRDSDFVCFTLSSNNSGYLPVTSSFINSFNIVDNGYTVVADVGFGTSLYQRDSSLDLLSFQQTLILVLVLLSVLFVFYLFRCKINWFNRGC